MRTTFLYASMTAALPLRANSLESLSSSSYLILLSCSRVDRLDDGCCGSSCASSSCIGTGSRVAEAAFRRVLGRSFSEGLLEYCA
jgi:hypothetical protein